MRAALQCAARLATLDRVKAAFGGKVRQRIGLNSGEALVGNIGSRRRFNYTVMGDMVNLASRLEGANKFFGTTIIASEATVALTGQAFVWRELDADPGQGPQPGGEDLRAARRGGRACRWTRCCGRKAMPRAWPAIARAISPAPRQSSRRFATDDPPAARLPERARQLAQNPPGPDWEPVNTQDEK